LFFKKKSPMGGSRFITPGPDGAVVSEPHVSTVAPGRTKTMTVAIRHTRPNGFW
jgi:hypothetical protein